MKHRFTPLAVVLSAFLISCGGGGGGGETAAVGTGTNPGGTPVVDTGVVTGGTPTPSGPCQVSVAQGFSGDVDLVAAGNGGGDGGAGSGSGGAGVGGGLGKVIGGRVQVHDLSDGALVGEAITDRQNGLVTVKTCTRQGPFLVTLTGVAGAQYYDEGRGQMVDFGVGNVLHAMVDVWDEHVGVSPLTEAAYRFALNNYKVNPADVAAGRAVLQREGSVAGLTRDQVKAANAMVLTIINLRNLNTYAMASAKTLPKPVDQNSSSSTLSNTRYGVSAVVNGGLVKSASNYNPLSSTPALNLTEEFARDLTDGRLDGFALDGTAANGSGASSYHNTKIPTWSAVANNNISTQFAGGRIDAGQRVIVDVVTNLEYYRSPPLIYEDTINPHPDNVVRDKAILFSDGTVTMQRTTSSGTTVTNNFMTGVKRLFYFRAPALFAATPFMYGLDTAVQQAYALKDDGTVWTWGSSYHCINAYYIDPSIDNQVLRSYERLFFDSNNNLNPRRLDSLKNITDISVSSFNDNFMARDANGDVYVWGRDVTKPVYRQPSSGVLAIRTLSKSGDTTAVNSESLMNSFKVIPTCISTPQIMSGLPRIRHIGSGTNAQIAVADDGRVFGWGSGFEVGLGLRDASTFNGLGDAAFVISNVITRPTVIAGLGKVRALTVQRPLSLIGSNHSFIVTNTANQSYLWGGSTSAPQELFGLLPGVSPFVFRDLGTDLTALGTLFLQEGGTTKLAKFTFSGSGSYQLTDVNVPSVRELKAVGGSVLLFRTDGRVSEVNSSGQPVDVTQQILTFQR